MKISWEMTRDLAMRTDKKEELRQVRNRVDQEGQAKKDDNTSAVGACAEGLQVDGSSFVKTTPKVFASRRARRVRA